MTIQARGLATVAASLLFAACAPSQGAAFGPVESMALDRTGYSVSWHSRAMDDERYAEKLREILAEPLTSDAAVKIALLNNRDLQASFESIGLGIAEVAGATLANPELEAELRFPIDGDGTSIMFTGIQDLFSLVTLPARRSAANAELNARRYRALRAVTRLTAEVRIAFYELQANQQVEELRRSALASQEAQLELVERLREAGNTTALAFAQERARLGELKLALARAELETATAREALNSQLGLTGKDTGWSVESRLADLPAEPLDLGKLESEAIGKSIALEEKRWEMKAASARLGVARVESVVPALGAGVAAEREFGGEWSVGPVVSLALPLWDQGKSGRAKYGAMLRRAQYRYSAIAVRERATARVVRATLELARARTTFIFSELLPSRQQVVREMLAQYNAMNATPFEVLAARRAELAAGVEYIEGLRDYWRAWAMVAQVRMGDAESVKLSEETEMPTAMDADESGDDE